MTPWLAILLGWCFEKAQMQICAFNYNALWNGFGAITMVINGKSKAPMQYRVLVPWLVGLIEKTGIKRIAIYQGLKVILNSLAFYAIGLALGNSTAIVSCVLLLLTIKYDYWDWAAEITGVYLAMTGNPMLAGLGGVIAGMSKETALLVPIAYFLKTNDLVGSLAVLLITLVTILIPRLVYGKKELYCDRFMVGYNGSLFYAFIDKTFYSWGQFYHTDIFIALFITILSVLSTLSKGTITGVIPLMVLIAGWTMAKADETRVFALCIPWIANWLVSFI